jgi:hypothetical protein
MSFFKVEHAFVRPPFSGRLFYFKKLKANDSRVTAVQLYVEETMKNRGGIRGKTRITF